MSESLALVEKISRNNPFVLHKTLKDCGHSAIVEQYDELIAQIEDFALTNIN